MKKPQLKQYVPQSGIVVVDGFHSFLNQSWMNFIRFSTLGDLETWAFQRTTGLPTRLRVKGKSLGVLG